MKNKTAVLISVLLALSVIGSAVIMQAQAESKIALTTTVDGWLTDLGGNLVTDSSGYYVLTLSPGMISGNKLTADLNSYAALFLKSFYNESSAKTTYKLKIVNNSGKKLTYSEYEFLTENVLPRSTNIFTVSTGTLTNSYTLNRAFGSAYTAMLSTLTSPTYRTDLCLNVKGFDVKNINLMIVNLRCVNNAIKAFYGVTDATDISLPQMMNLDANLISAGYTGYADYLCKYYHVLSLYDIPLDDVYNILGTTHGAQSGITNWRNNTLTGKPIPASEVNQLTNQFKIWGFLDLNLDVKDKLIYPYCPNYFIMETDAEVIQFAYDYLYSHGLRFSFNQSTRPFDTTDSEMGRGGDFGIKAYINKTAGATANVNAIFGGLVLGNGDSIPLDHVTAGLYVPNAWNQYRLYDFGLDLTFTVEGSTVTTTQATTTTTTTTTTTVPTTTTLPATTTVSVTTAVPTTAEVQTTEQSRGIEPPTTVEESTEHSHGALPPTFDNQPVLLVGLISLVLLMALAIQLTLFYRKKKNADSSNLNTPDKKDQ